MASAEHEQEYAWKEDFRKVKEEIELLKKALKKKEAARKSQEEPTHHEEKALFIERTDKKKKDTSHEAQDTFDKTPGVHDLFKI